MQLTNSMIEEQLEIYFKPLDETDFELVYFWFNQPHIQTFYSLRPWSRTEIWQKLKQHVQGDKGIKVYIIYVKDEPVGYIQCYPVKNNLWENNDVPANIVNDAAGVDLFLGRKDDLRKGLGTKIVGQFLERHVWPFYRYCISDPDARNEASIRLFLKCGFSKYSQIRNIDALGKPTKLEILIKDNKA